jgi:phosphoribosylformylglycinamidine (FGAM) synthase-like amidotransferase family enzyme
MSINFDELLTNDQKAELIRNRIAQFAAEAYQLTLNRKTAQTVSEEANLENIDKSLSMLETAISVHKEELVKLESN